MKAGHEEEYADVTSAAPWPQLDGVRPKTSPSLVDDRRSEDGVGRGGAKYNITNRNSQMRFRLTPRSMTLTCYKFDFFRHFADFADLGTNNG